MTSSYSTAQPNKVDVYFLPNGTTHVYLRDNIRQEQVEVPSEDSVETQTFWVSDELELTADSTYTKEYVESNFDKVWVEAQSKEKSTSQRLDEVETMISALSTVLTSALSKE